MRETYRLLQECAVDELHGTVRVLTHERTGARILTIKNNDVVYLNHNYINEFCMR